MKKSKRLISMSIVVLVIMLVVSVILFNSGKKPMKNLSADIVLYIDVSMPISGQLAVLGYTSQHKHVYKSSDIDNISNELRKIVVYDKAKQNKNSGQVVAYKLTMKNGTVKQIIISSSIITIDGVSYRAKRGTIEYLTHLYEDIDYESVQTRGEG